MIPANSNIAATVVALLIKKGGKLRLRRSELEDASDLVLTLQVNPQNPEVLHIDVISRAEADAAMAFLSALRPPPGDSDANGK